MTSTGDGKVNKTASVGSSMFENTADEIEQEQAASYGGAKLTKVEVGDKTFLVGKDPERDAEIYEIKKIAEKESGQCQFLKQGICTGLLALVVLMNILQPSQH